MKKYVLITDVQYNVDNEYTFFDEGTTESEAIEAAKKVWAEMCSYDDDEGMICELFLCDMTGGRINSYDRQVWAQMRNWG